MMKKLGEKRKQGTFTELEGLEEVQSTWCIVYHKLGEGGKGRVVSTG